MSVFIGSVSEEKVTLEDVARLRNLGFRVELSKDGLGHAFVGVAFPKKSVYHWFKLWNGWLFFDHSYSQNTGESKSGVMHGLRVKQSVLKAIRKAKR